MLPQALLPALGLLIGMISVPSRAFIHTGRYISSGNAASRLATRSVASLDLSVGPVRPTATRKRASLGFLSALLWRSAAGEHQQCTARGLLSLSGGAQARTLTTMSAAPVDQVCRYTHDQ